MNLFRDIQPANLHYYRNDEVVTIAGLAKWIYEGGCFNYLRRQWDSAHLLKSIYGGGQINLRMRTF